jgi:hypothetical protein
MDEPPKLQQITPFESLDIALLSNPQLPTIRALAFNTRYGAFLFALDRAQMEKVAEMIKRELEQMPLPS